MGDKVFYRIVYLKTLKEFHDIYQDEEMLINYCLWLAQNYHLIEEKIISMCLSEDVGIWKNGISIIVSDEKKLLISTGSFSDVYNNKGILLNNKEISQMFKEYAKVLSAKSKQIRARNIIKYFSFDKKLTKLPKSIKLTLDEKNFSKLKAICEEYVLNNI
jgi:hypothetical protein